MWHNLEQAYIPSCVDCLHNNSRMTKPTGPLHPLPVPDHCGQSVAMDFIGPLPLDDSYNCILSMTDQLGADIWIIPTHIDIDAENLAVLFFDNWYCKNRLPANVMCDCTSYSSPNFRRHSLSLQASPWKCRQLTTWKLMVLANNQTKLSTKCYTTTSVGIKNAGLECYAESTSKLWILSTPLQAFLDSNYILVAHHS